MQQTIPYDVSLDPDDSYEEIVREKAVKVRMNMRVSSLLNLAVYFDLRLGITDNHWTRREW